MQQKRSTNLLAFIALSFGWTACSAAAGPPMPLTAQQTARVCTLLDLCGGSIPDCVSTVAVFSRQSIDPITRSVIDCAISAATCEAYIRCVSGNRPNEGSSRCEGSTLLSNAGGVVLPISCAEWSGGTCAMEGSTPRCVPSGGCDPMAPSRCDGTRRINCNARDTVLAAVDCARLYPNGRCAMSGGNAVCVPSDLPACSTVGTSCMGNTLVRCSTEPLNGAFISAGAWDAPRATQIDCAALGGTCMTSGSEARCVPSATACATNAPPRCSGTNLEVCVQGNWQTVACPSLGHPYCIQPMDGAGYCSLTPPMMGR